VIRNVVVGRLRPAGDPAQRAAEFIAEGKGDRQRLIPVSGRFFAAVAAYLDGERPPGAGTDRVFVVLKGPRRGQPLSAKVRTLPAA
jgi:integrase/recombinase XerD